MRMGGEEGRGGSAYSFVACLLSMAHDHASISRLEMEHFACLSNLTIEHAPLARRTDWVALYTYIYIYYFSHTLLLSSFWTSRGHRCRPFSPPVLAFNSYPAQGSAIPKLVDFSSSAVNSRSRAFRKSISAQEEVPTNLYEYALGGIRTHETDLYQTQGYSDTPPGRQAIPIHHAGIAFTNTTTVKLILFVKAQSVPYWSSLKGKHFCAFELCMGKTCMFEWGKHLVGAKTKQNRYNPRMRVGVGSDNVGVTSGGGRRGRWVVGRGGRSMGTTCRAPTLASVP